MSGLFGLVFDKKENNLNARRFEALEALLVKLLVILLDGRVKTTTTTTLVSQFIRAMLFQSAAATTTTTTTTTTLVSQFIRRFGEKRLAVENEGNIVRVVDKDAVRQREAVQNGPLVLSDLFHVPCHRVLLAEHFRNVTEKKGLGVEAAIERDESRAEDGGDFA